MSFAKLARIAAAIIITAAGSAYAQMPFKVISPAQPTDPDKIEVLEFFWYGCPHCFHLEPVINAWEKGLPKDVVFKRVPASLLSKIEQRLSGDLQPAACDSARWN